MIRYYGFLGLLLVLESLIGLISGFQSLLISYIGLEFGLWLLFDSLDYEIRGNSFLNDRNSLWRAFLLFAVIGIFVGGVIEIYGAFLAKLWGSLAYSDLLTEPVKALSKYSLNYIWAYGLLILPAYSIYRVLEGIQADHELSHGFTEEKEELFLQYSIYISILFLAVPFLTGISGDQNSVIRLLGFGSSLIGLWLLAEYFEFRKHKRGLIKDIFELKIDRLASIVLTSVILGFIFEYANLFDQVWRYQNVPFLSVKLAGVPVIIVLGWIPLTVILLSFFNIFFREEEPLF